MPQSYRERRLLVQILFTVALFVSATLVFWVQPMFGKMLLPLLGGTPAVWNTCLVFFQAALLLGYLYAHGQGTWLGIRTQVVVHLILLAGYFFIMPIGVPGNWYPPTDSNPIPWLLVVLSLSLGLPFVLLSSTAPLLQSWYARSGGPGAQDPYFLYVASNVGSVAGLLAYPFLIEPHVSLSRQSWAWTAGYGLFVACAVAAAWLVWPRDKEASSAAPPLADPQEKVPRLRWLMLAAVPSSLLQSVTTFLTMDIAAIPLLWVIPLAIYLLSFILVFSRREIMPHEVMVRLQPVALVALVVLVFCWDEKELVSLLPLTLVVLFLTCMVCHAELARSRPKVARLTEFYLWMSLGGVLGGIFNAIVAPLVFSSLVEYPLTLVLAGLLRPRADAGTERWWGSWKDYVLPFMVWGALVGGVQVGEKSFGYTLSPVFRALVPTLAGLLVWLAFGARPIRFGLGLAALVMAGIVTSSFGGTPEWRTVHSERSFFGVVRVKENDRFQQMRLVHGTTSHGSQNRPASLRGIPTTYYYRGGPLGDFFNCLPPVPEGRKVAVGGLGAGTMALYAAPEDRWVFYEIDPVVKRVAEDRRFFTYLSDVPRMPEVVLGDARLELEKAPDRFFDLIVIDAFSSDSIPVHLLTREAIRSYLLKLKPAGLLALHISNAHLRLERVVARVAADAGLFALIRDQDDTDRQSKRLGALPSTWVALARTPAELSALARTPEWQQLTVAENDPARVWTDDYSNVLECLKLGDSPAR
ncbi:MAG: fused MFS/spermidine synthase [Thermodesulfobacteriota bacterium]